MKQLILAGWIFAFPLPGGGATIVQPGTAQPPVYIIPFDGGASIIEPENKATPAPSDSDGQNAQDQSGDPDEGQP